jgi:glycosyltransferase involved in cell wall biosynthesis
MVVLHIAPINTTVVNGFRFSVPGLVSAQGKMGIKVALLNVEKPELYSEEKLEKKNIKVIQGKVIKLNEIEEPFNKPDIVIFHGVYKTEYLSLYKQLTKNNIPYVIVPRVSLTKGAQTQKILKKKLSNFLFFNKFINNASAIHYLTHNEKKLSLKFKQNSFVVGNGIDLPLLQERTIKEQVNLSFIGRYDVKHKGLDVLMLAIISIKDFLRENNVQVCFYGSNFKGGKEKLLGLIEDHKLSEVISINEAIFGKEKDDVLRNTDVFLATSRFEGHPMAVIEAMSYGIPCILTEGTNMQEDLIKYDAGWDTDLAPNEIAKKIVKAVQSPSEISNKGLNARKLIEENYTWEKVAEQSVEFYREIISEN